MDINDLNRRIRYALSMGDADVLTVLKLSQYDTDIDSIAQWRSKEGEAGHKPCPPEALYALLDGLIVQLRGARDPESVASEPTPTSAPTFASANEGIDNNEVLKRLRIALSLKADEVGALINAGGGKLGKSEVNALFRNPSARNYRRCGDQVLRWFLTGLAKKRDV